MSYSSFCRIDNLNIQCHGIVLGDKFFVGIKTSMCTFICTTLIASPQNYHANKKKESVSCCSHRLHRHDKLSKTIPYLPDWRYYQTSMGYSV